MIQRIFVAMLAVPLGFLAAAHAETRLLRVCADPNNLPFSNRAGEGFENKIVDLIANNLHATVSYTWWAQRRGFVRNTLKAATCALWPGVATKLDMLATTQPYYRSSYVFVTRADRHLTIDSFDDPRLHSLTIGVQMVGNDAMNTPPTHALARRGIINNVRGYMLYGDYTKPNPPSAIIDAVGRGDIDVAIAWGPLAGYFASRATPALAVTPVDSPTDGPRWPMAFDISMGLRHGEPAFKQEVDQALARDHAAIDAILAEYHVPLMEDAGGAVVPAQN
jgi:mxaJ protein